MWLTSEVQVARRARAIARPRVPLTAPCTPGGAGGACAAEGSWLLALQWRCCAPAAASSGAAPDCSRGTGAGEAGGGEAGAGGWRLSCATSVRSDATQTLAAALRCGASGAPSSRAGGMSGCGAVGHAAEARPPQVCPCGVAHVPVRKAARCGVGGESSAAAQARAATGARGGAGAGAQGAADAWNVAGWKQSGGSTSELTELRTSPSRSPSNTSSACTCARTPAGQARAHRRGSSPVQTRH